LENCDCPLCESRPARTLATEIFAGYHFGVVQCVNCGMVYTKPRPSAAWRAAFHDPKFRNMLVDRGVIAETHRVPESKVSVFDLEHQTAHVPSFERGLQVLGDSNRRRLLDVGCSAGRFVALANERGFEAEGTDIQPEAVQQGRAHFGVRLHCGDLLAQGFPAGSYDVVTMWDVLEHLPDPVAYLREVARILKWGGRVLVQVPNNSIRVLLLAAGLKRPKPGEYPMISFEHIQHWTPAMLTRALQRAGFEEIRILPGRKEELNILPQRARRLADRIIRAASRGRTTILHPMLAVGVRGPS
jgi:2-polyprenyl-3-methyl-5-hydroxy-6-metoxy-1,4-benzoquinol methylase